MTWKTALELLMPTDEEQEPAFREELSRLATIGLRAIGCICLCTPIVAYVSALLLRPERLTRPDLWQIAALIVIGATITRSSFIGAIRPFARLLGVFIGYMMTMMVVVCSTAVSLDLSEEAHHLPGKMTTIMLVCIAALPLRPLQTLTLGLSITASYATVLVVAPSFGQFPGSDPLHVIDSLIVTLTCSGLTIIIYAQRSSAYRSRQQALQSFEELRRTQARLLLSEAAASQGRLAAVLSHELNSPIGTLNSSVETLMRLYQRKPGPEEAQLAGMFESVAQATSASCQRLKEIVARMQRFANLDRAEEQAADLNELLRDTVGLLQSELNQRAEVILDLKPLARLKCRPQQLSAVFLNLIRNAIDHVEEKGRICVTTIQSLAEIAIQVSDNGQGIAAERLPYLFEPSFAVREERVTSSNWGLFTSRTIIVAHGGQISIDSTEHKGTIVTVRLPA